MEKHVFHEFFLVEKQLELFLLVFSKREGPWESQICSWSRARATHGPPGLLTGAWISIWVCGREGKQDRGRLRDLWQDSSYLELKTQTSGQG